MRTRFVCTFFHCLHFYLRCCFSFLACNCQISDAIFCIMVFWHFSDCVHMCVAHFFVHFLAWLFAFSHCTYIPLFSLFFPIVLRIICLFFLPSFTHLHCLIVLQVLAVLLPSYKRLSIVNIGFFLRSGLEIVIVVGGAIRFVVLPLFFCVFFSFHALTFCPDYFAGLPGLIRPVQALIVTVTRFFLRYGL